MLLVPALADSLAGRMQILRLHPLSQVELANPAGTPERAGPGPGFFDSLFAEGFAVASSGRLGDRLRERIAAGG